MFDCFPDFLLFTNHAFVILALICNLNLHVLSPTLHQAYLLCPKLLFAVFISLLGSSCGQKIFLALGKLPVTGQSYGMK